jgi:hypothetical protein
MQYHCRDRDPLPAKTSAATILVINSTDKRRRDNQDTLDALVRYAAQVIKRAHVHGVQPNGECVGGDDLAEIDDAVVGIVKTVDKAPPSMRYSMLT